MRVATTILVFCVAALLALGLFAVWLALYFGRPTWGRLVVKYFGEAAPEILRRARAQ